MKKLLPVLGIAVLLFGCGASKKSASKASSADYASSITSDELKELLYKYASDEFEGRETGEKGQKLAVEYLKSKYKSMGIPSPLSGDDYFQEVPLEKQGIATATLSVNGKAFNSFEDHIVLRLAESINISASDIVYAGYGIDDEKYSDYNNIDVKGKIVLIKGGEPKDASGNFVTSGTTEATKWTNGRQSIPTKRDAAQKRGASMVLLMDTSLFGRYSPFYKRQAESGASGRLSIKSSEKGMSMLMINESLGKALNASIMDDNTPKVLNAKLELSAKNKTESVTSENVVAFIKGSEKPDEIVVISAHLDHEGIKDGEIYNGADDDGSGTVAVLEIAQAFKLAEKAGHGPKRSILFLHVTGEEKGLLGSSYYADRDPILPLANTVVDLNIDMIGRIDPKRKSENRNYVYLIGADKLSSELHTISEEVNAKYSNIELDYTYNDEDHPDRIYYRSDHWSFAKNDIPVIFYFNGTHDDYHKPSDTPDKIEYDLLENRTRLVFHTAWEIANRDKRIVVDKATKK